MRLAIPLGLILSLAPEALLAQGSWDAPCPAPDATQGYVDTAVDLGSIGTRTGQLHFYYKMLKPFDPSKETLLIINGGPGGDHSIVDSFSPVADDYNVVSYDHRGLGCTKIQAQLDSAYTAGLYSMDRAADDLDALRQHLVGKDGKWLVYGVSYGGMLGQKYAFKYQDHIQALILDSTFYRSDAIDVGRHRYVDLFIAQNGGVKMLFDQVTEKYPDARANILRKIWTYTYSYQGRTKEIYNLLNTVQTAATPDQARDAYKEDLYTGPMAGMTPDILCTEIWDFNNSDQDASTWYFAEFAHGCEPYRATRAPMAWGEELKKLKVRTFLWSGGFDPVTPSPVMEEMHALIPGSLFFKNPYTGHGQYFEKQECALKLMRMFYASAADADIQGVIDSKLCQSPPNEEESIPMDWARLTNAKRPAFDRRMTTEWTKEREEKITGGSDWPVRPSNAAPLLRVLGLMNSDGSLPPDSLRKLSQINHMVTLLLPHLEDLAGRHPMVGIVDACCGTSYLALLLAWVFKERMQKPVSIVGVDANAKVIETSTKRAEKLGFGDSVRFVTGKVGEVDLTSVLATPRPHLLVALHACDTATDQALALGIKLKADVMAVAPCCQAELARKWKDLGPEAGAFGPIFRAPNLRRETAAQLTDAYRMLLVRSRGYEVTPTEFVPSEHTHKNRLLTCVRRGRYLKEAAEQHDTLKVSLGGVGIALEALLPVPEDPAHA